LPLTILRYKACFDRSTGFSSGFSLLRGPLSAPNTERAIGRPHAADRTTTNRRHVNRIGVATKQSIQALAGSSAARSLLKAATAMPRERAKGSEGTVYRLAKRAHYPQSAGFTYRRDGCAPLELCLAGAALSLFYLGDYEPGSLRAVVTLARHAHTFLDIGAQAGVYSMVVASANPEIEVVAFEADPSSVATVLENARRNRGRSGVGSVRVCAAAVDDHSGLATFHLAGGNSSLNGAFRSNTQELLCPKVSIDDFLEAIDHSTPIDLVKIDTESTEPAVLRGMRRTIERWRPVIILEVLRGRTEEALDAFLAESHYRALWLSQDGPQVVNTVVGDSTHADLNYLFVPIEKCIEVFSLLEIAQP